jgi:hypothetical protein
VRATIFCRPVTSRAILTAFSFASAPDRQKNVFSRPGGVISVSSSAARSLDGKAALGVTSRPRAAASASALRMRGWPCPSPAFQVMLPRSHQRAPSAVTKRAPAPSTISSGTAPACALQV